jgi:hypothetical protein
MLNQIQLFFLPYSHRLPPLKLAEEYHVDDELLAQLEEKCMDKAKRRLEAETCVRVIKHQHLGQVEIAQNSFVLKREHFVVVRSLGMIIFTFLFLCLYTTT